MLLLSVTKIGVHARKFIWKQQRIEPNKVGGRWHYHHYEWGVAGSFVSEIWAWICCTARTWLYSSVFGSKSSSVTAPPSMARCLGPVRYIATEISVLKIRHIENDIESWLNVFLYLIVVLFSTTGEALMDMQRNNHRFYVDDNTILKDHPTSNRFQNPNIKDSIFMFWYFVQCFLLLFHHPFWPSTENTICFACFQNRTLVCEDILQNLADFAHKWPCNSSSVTESIPRGDYDRALSHKLESFSMCYIL